MGRRDYATNFEKQPKPQRAGARREGHPRAGARFRRLLTFEEQILLIYQDKGKHEVGGVLLVSQGRRIIQAPRKKVTITSKAKRSGLSRKSVQAKRSESRVCDENQNRIG